MAGRSWHSVAIPTLILPTKRWGFVACAGDPGGLGNLPEEADQCICTSSTSSSTVPESLATPRWTEMGLAPEYRKVLKPERRVPGQISGGSRFARPFGNNGSCP
jgi:hypothetical protein